MGQNRKLKPLVVATVVWMLVFVGAVPAAADQGCTGQTASTVAPATVPFGANIVAPTAMAVDNFGLDVIKAEATAPHDACP